MAEVKLRTNTLERELSSCGKRAVNIDPGYITLSKAVLATTKNYSHRIYLREGIYAEITLAWEKGTFTPRPWTYPDYRTDTAVSFFNRARKLLR
jgi:hypothetical protein